MKKLLLATAAVLATATTTFAANNGTVGATSSGDLDLTLTIAEQIIVTNLDDVDLLDGTAAQTESICVAGNIATPYDIRFTSGQGSFILNHGSVADTIAYTVGYDHGATGTFAPATYNTTIVDAGAVFATNLDCDAAANNNGDIQITPNAGDVSAATAGTYTGTLNIEVAATL